MTVRVLTAPCWVIQWAGYPVTGQGTHYETEEASRRVTRDGDDGQLARHKNCGGLVIFGIGCETEGISDAGWEALACTPARLPHPCWVADSDSPHALDFTLGEEDGFTLHEPTEASMTARVHQWGWAVSTDGLIYPDKDDAPPGTLFLPPRPPRRPGCRSPPGSSPCPGRTPPCHPPPPRKGKHHASNARPRPGHHRGP